VLDLSLKIAGKGGIRSLDKFWSKIIDNLCVFLAIWLLYFAYYAIGCDWAELIIALKLIVIENKNNEVVE